MIRTIALTKDMCLLKDTGLERLNKNDIKWFWMDFDSPNEEEENILKEEFNFHELSIEDCLYNVERPKVDYYDTYNFFVLYSLNQNTFMPEELDIFVSKNFIVTFHKSTLSEINSIMESIVLNENICDEGNAYIAYSIFDKVVDQYFPAAYKIEDSLSRIDIRVDGKVARNIMDKVFDIRQDLLKLRRIVYSMKELVYRIINSVHLHEFRDNKLYFNDIYDHLLQLSDIIESNREITADMRDSYISINSDRMNRIMTVLTIITTIFIPLTFIAGIYGMNFKYIPELEWKYGYFTIIGLMLLIGWLMYLWFKRKGWFDIYK